MSSNRSIAVEVYPAARPSQIASARVKLTTDLGVIAIDDCRLLRNKSGVVWFSLPSYSLPTNNRQFEYRATLEVPPDLLQQISTEALRAYNAWHAQQTNETKTQSQGASFSVQPNYSHR
jgi:hypothetical protein